MTNLKKETKVGIEEESKGEEIEEKIVQIDRISRVVKGGRRLRFRAVVVVGDKSGKVGIGVAKGTEVPIAISKAALKAKKAIIPILIKDTTIPHEVYYEFAGAKVFLKPASEGTGIVAGGPVRAVVEAVGIKDILSKMLGSGNKVNNVYATFLALKSLRPIKEKFRKEDSKSKSGIKKDIKVEKKISKKSKKKR